MVQQTYAVIGAGAVGGFYGATLQRAGFQVEFLFNRDYDWVMEHGLSVRSPAGDFDLPQVRGFRSTQLMQPADVILVALKTTQNHCLARLLPPLLKPNSTIVMLQNGLGIEAAIAHVLHEMGHDQVSLVGGLCFLCSNKTQPGVIQHLDYGLVNMGQYGALDQPMGITATLQQLATDFQQADIDVKLWENLLLQRWKKLIWNIPFNGLSVLLDAKTSELMADSTLVNLVTDLMAEIQAAAASYHCEIPSDFVAFMLDLTTKMHPYRTSMKLDFDGGREMEVETMFGNPYRAAQANQVETPKLEMLYTQLTFLNGRIKSSLV